MIGSHRVEGYAIVSTEGMIADSNGVMPPAIRNEADQRYLQAEMDRAALIVHGRHSSEGGPRAPQRKRLVVTRRIAALAADPENPNALLWNPDGATIEQAIAKSGAPAGTIAIIGGTGIFGMFLPLYDAFGLTRAEHATIPGGRPVFPQVGAGTSPENVLSAHGLHPGPHRVIDAAAGVSLTMWERR